MREWSWNSDRAGHTPTQKQDAFGGVQSTSLLFKDTQCAQHAGVRPPLSRSMTEFPSLPGR
jgi:hypothetical protein